MPAAQILVITERADGVVLDRLAEDGAEAGDTWHTSVEDAKEQAIYEYGEKVIGWLPMPEGVTDVIQWLRRQ